MIVGITVQDIVLDLLKIAAGVLAPHALLFSDLAMACAAMSENGQTKRIGTLIIDS
jgi:hypothetical protein